MKLAHTRLTTARAKNGFSGLVSQLANMSAPVLGGIERQWLCPSSGVGGSGAQQARMVDIAGGLGEHDHRRPPAAPFFTPTRENRLAIW